MRRLAAIGAAAVLAALIAAAPPAAAGTHAPRVTLAVPCNYIAANSDWVCYARFAANEPSAFRAHAIAPTNATAVITGWSVTHDNIGPTCAGSIYSPTSPAQPVSRQSLRFRIPRNGRSGVCDVFVIWVFLVPNGSSTPQAYVTGKAGSGV